MSINKENKSREISAKRAEELKERISDYLEAAPHISTGFTEWDRIKENQKNIQETMGASNEEWYDWKWQLRNRITDADYLHKLLSLSTTEYEEINTTGSRFRWAASPYYLSLINSENPLDPVRLQCIPSIQEYYDTMGDYDPMDEEHTSPAPAVTRRYPDRLIINVTNQCAMYCRHCQRRRNIGEVDKPTPQEELEKALDYVWNNEEIRDILLTGGDAFMLDNKTIDWILGELDRIPHVEIKRLGTRTPVTLPYRIDNELLDILSKHPPVYINTHFNHPLEVTPDAKEACLKLARAGVALGNQAVLLNRVNNDPHVMKKLNHELLKIMVRPYYIFHAKEVRETSHFRTRLEDGLEIMEKLRGYTSGLAIPTFLVNAPGGNGKTPMLPEYLISMGKGKITIRTWENKVFDYKNLGPEEAHDL